MINRFVRIVVFALAVGAGLLTLLLWATFFFGAAGFAGAYVLAGGLFTGLVATALFLFLYASREQAREDREHTRHRME